jgi:UDP-glucuronate 4-epimerase
MNILITGAAGFIGSHVAEYFLAQGDVVIGIDNFDAFYPKQIKLCNIDGALKNSNYTFLELDLLDVNLHEELKEYSIDVIIHLAGKAGVRPSIEDPLAYEENNVRATVALLEVTRKRGIPKMVFASSSSVYGVNKNVPWCEDDVLSPISPYAASKLSCEKFGEVYSNIFGIEFIALRFFTVYGPRQRPDLAIHKFAKMMMAGKPIPFFGDGSTARDYTYISDIVDCVYRSVKNCDIKFDVINVGNDRTIELHELVETLEETLGVKAVKNVLPEQLGDLPITMASIDKAKNLLGYEPKTTFREGIIRFVSWLHAQDQSSR